MATEAIQETDEIKAPTAGKKEWIGLAVIALPCLLYSMDLTVLNLALPAISEDLKPGSAQLLWIVDIYGFMVAGSLITMGTLGDRIGRRKLLMIGAGAFGVASVMAAFSSSAGMLIAARCWVSRELRWHLPRFRLSGTCLQIPHSVRSLLAFGQPVIPLGVL
jgi:MFS family permease